MKPTPKLAQAIVNLRGNTNFDVFVEALKEFEALETERCKTQDVPTVYRVQGSAVTLEKILKVIEQAPESLSKFGRANTL